MKKLFEWLKDILYDSVDYIMVIGIIGIVVFIIGWRLDLLFPKEAQDTPPKNEIIVDNNIKPEDKHTPNTKLEDDDEEDKQTPDTNIVEDIPKEIKDPIVEPVDNNKNIVKIIIPAGSLPSKIASILESNNLISSKSDFVLKSQELKLDTKIKSGQFDITSGSTIEEILKIITK